MASNGQHVVLCEGGKWAVRKTGSLKATKIFNKKDDAIRAAHKISRNQRTELIIHGYDGRVRSRASYGRESLPLAR